MWEINVLASIWPQSWTFFLMMLPILKMISLSKENLMRLVVSLYMIIIIAAVFQTWLLITHSPSRIFLLDPSLCFLLWLLIAADHWLTVKMSPRTTDLFCCWFSGGSSSRTQLFSYNRLSFKSWIFCSSVPTHSSRFLFIFASTTDSGNQSQWFLWRHSILPQETCQILAVTLH